jgi:hypothetical protein
MVQDLICNQAFGGSSPSPGTITQGIKIKNIVRVFFCFAAITMLMACDSRPHPPDQFGIITCH